MNILAIADKESAALWDYYDPERLKDVDLILSCGDLDPRYLSFLVTMKTVPLLYIHGNHDDKYKTIPPDGCICIEDDVYKFEGLRIAGLGGCMRYSKGINQYTEREMEWRVRRLGWKIRMAGGVDILITHAPVYQMNDGEDLCHQGFACFRELLDKYQPMVLFHGHVHMSYGRQYKRHDYYKRTHIVNVYEKFFYEV